IHDPVAVALLGDAEASGVEARDGLLDRVAQLAIDALRRELAAPLPARVDDSAQVRHLKLLSRPCEVVEAELYPISALICGGWSGALVSAESGAIRPWARPRVSEKIACEGTGIEGVADQAWSTVS